MRSKIKIMSCVLAVIMCMTAFSFTAFAGYFASDENGNDVPPSSIDSITVSTENVQLPDQQDDTPLTPDGNMNLIDDILQSDLFASVETTETVANKQFITVQTKNGSYFYLVIDRAGDAENVYFLNLVDESDLLALIEDEEPSVAVVSCDCIDKCVIGSINTSCEVCRTNISDCEGKEKIVEIEPEPEIDKEPEKPADNKKSSGGLLIIILVIIGGAGGAVYWFMFRNNQTKNKGNSNLNDYDFGQDDDEIDDSDLMDEADNYNDEEKK